MISIFNRSPRHSADESFGDAASNALIDKPGLGMKCVDNYDPYNWDKTYVQCSGDAASESDCG